MTAAIRLHNNSAEQYQSFHENAKGFGEDPLTLNKMDDPVIIECGHLLNRASFQDVVNHANLTQIFVRCPTCRIRVNPNIAVPGFEFRNVIHIIGKLEEENDLLMEENKELTNELAHAVEVASRSIPYKLFMGFRYYFNVLDHATNTLSLSEAKRDIDAYWDKPAKPIEWVVVPGQDDSEEEGEYDARKT